MLLFIVISSIPSSIKLYFNTSHVTVYRYVTYHKNGIKTFQYISCYCLSLTALSSVLLLHISIHLMLLFIRNVSDDTLRLITFQYISCYCLSMVPALVNICLSYFNTSHVTVYRCLQR